jgi:hypothetical protein
MGGHGEAYLAWELWHNLIGTWSLTMHYYDNVNVSMFPSERQHLVGLEHTVLIAAGKAPRLSASLVRHIQPMRV